MFIKIIIVVLLLTAIPLVLLGFILWYPVAAVLRFADRSVPYPHEHFRDFLKGERLHAH
jgi:hypothetical protein